jgi:hypothetical protein
VQEHEFHPFADAFPMMTSQEHAELVADIKANGQREAITRYHGKLLDGRNRDKACRELGIKPNYTDFGLDDDAALTFVISKNLVRRHLTTSQRAMIAAALSTLRHGQRKSDTSNDVSQVDAAKLLHVSLPTTQRARKVIEKGSPELAAAVRAGDVSVSAAVAQIASNQVAPIGTCAPATNGHDVGAGAEIDDPGESGHDTLASLDERVWSGPAEETATLCLARLLGHIIGKCEHLEGFFDKHPELDDEVIKASLNAVLEEGIERLKEAIQHIEKGQA